VAERFLASWLLHSGERSTSRGHIGGARVARALLRLYSNGMRAVKCNAVKFQSPKGSFQSRPCRSIGEVKAAEVKFLVNDIINIVIKFLPICHCESYWSVVVTELSFFFFGTESH
jgi:hypothetical protein